jgi:hypothetical protein
MRWQWRATAENYRSGHEEVLKSGYKFRAFLNSAVHENEWRASRSRCHTPGKSPQYPMKQEVGWVPQSAWTMWSTQKLLPLPDIKLQFLCCRARSTTTMPIELARPTSLSRCLLHNTSRLPYPQKGEGEVHPHYDLVLHCILCRQPYGWYVLYSSSESSDMWIPENMLNMQFSNFVLMT